MRKPKCTIKNTTKRSPIKRWQDEKIPCHKTRTTDTRRLNLKFFAAQIQIPLLNKYLGVGYKGLVFCRNNG